MAEREDPSIGNLLDELDRERLAREDSRQRSLSARREAAAAYRATIDDTILPVARELERELRRRRHGVKVTRTASTVRIAVGIHGRVARQGWLEITPSPDHPEKLRIEYEGLETLPNRYDVAFERCDRPLMTRAVMRLVEGLMES